MGQVAIGRNLVGCYGHRAFANRRLSIAGVPDLISAALHYDPVLHALIAVEMAIIGLRSGRTHAVYRLIALPAGISPDHEAKRLEKADHAGNCQSPIQIN
jgi:hypothetical protein